MASSMAARSGLRLTEALRRASTPSNPLLVSKNCFSSASHDDAYETAKWEKITYTGIMTCTLLSAWILSKGHAHYPDPPAYPYLHIRNKEFLWAVFKEKDKNMSSSKQLQQQACMEGPKRCLKVHGKKQSTSSTPQLSIFKIMIGDFQEFLRKADIQMIKVVNYLWQPDASSYQHVWPAMEFGWQIVVGSIIGFFRVAFGSIGGGGIFVVCLMYGR